MARKILKPMSRNYDVDMDMLVFLIRSGTKNNVINLILIIESEEITIFRKHTLLIPFKR